jgi:hypothetical protein
MSKIIRNVSDEAGRAFWDSARKSAEGVRDWPSWKKAGITVEQPGVASSPTPPNPPNGSQLSSK